MRAKAQAFQHKRPIRSGISLRTAGSNKRRGNGCIAFPVDDLAGNSPGWSDILQIRPASDDILHARRTINLEQPVAHLLTAGGVFDGGSGTGTNVAVFDQSSNRNGNIDLILEIPGW